MSVIQTIRNKYGKIAGAIIALALIGFIVQDARNGSFGGFFRSNDNTVVKVNGTKIDPKEYQVRLKEYETLYSMFNKNRPIDDATRAQMNEQVVQMMVYETVVNEECDKLGIQTSEEEKKDMIYGENADPLVRQFQIEGQQIFINPQTNQFDPQIIKQFEKAIAEDPQKNDPTGKLREQWEVVKSYVRNNARVNKYNAMFTGAAYAPAYLAKRSTTDQNSLAAIKYVKVPFSTISDNDVKVTDDEIKAYMQKHSAMFETDQQTRTLEYVSFDIVPSSADTGRQIDALNQVKSDFAAATDNKSFVNSKSDETNSYTGAYFNKRTFTSRYADTISAQPVGSVFGPYYENGAYKLTKIEDRKTLPDSVHARHILVKTKERAQEVRSDSAAKQRLDSAIAALKSGVPFDSVEARFSDDHQPNKEKAGEYWLTLMQRPGFVKEFGDFAFEGNKGESKTVKVSSDNYSGYHYIEILDQVGIAPAVKLATITKVLSPSDSTVNAIYGKANEFAGKNQTAAEFDATVKKQNLDKRIGENIKVSNFSITGLGPSREVIRWAFAHKVGDVSAVFQLGEQRYVVAKLAAIDEKGMAGITAANRPMLEQRVKEEKKADLISKKFGASGSLDAIAGASGQQVQQSDSVTLGGAYIGGLGYEPKVVGYSFCNSFQPNTVSPGIKGQGGVYFITVLNRNVPQIDPNLMQMIMGQQRRQQEGQMRNAISQQLQPAEIKKADVKYNAENF
jgi:peptidyl-prolyl cis-trans isomerase D